MTKKLLLADDSITIQKVISIIFSTEDYQLIICDDGDEAFSRALAEYPDLVIADINMPGKDGFELCEAIKSAPNLANTSVLLLPGTFEHFDESRAEAVAADGWLSKPFESQALLDKVAQLIAAEPNRLVATEPEPYAPAAPVMAPSVADAGLDESVLGLDEVSELEGPVEDESAEDIWDAVSFEEEDLQPVEAEPLELVEAAEESDFGFVDTEEPLELTEEMVAETASETEAPLELTEYDEVTFADAPVVEETYAAEAFEEELPEAEFVSEALLEEDEEILELEEEDILEEDEVETVAEVAEEEFVVENDYVAETAVEEETVAFDDLPLEEELELAEASEFAVEPEFVAEPEPELEYVEEPQAAPAVELAVAGSSVEQVEQQLRGLSEDELKEVVARVAGPIIEKLANEMLEQIAWEVVPDLAESMIREEIRKIRQGAE